MRNVARAIVIGLLTFLSVIVLGVASAMTAAITLAATALIVPGTGTHNIGTVMGYKENARDRYIAPADPSCTAANGCILIGIDYPASFFPIPLPGWCPGLSCATWNKSVGQGVANLNSELLNQLANPTPDNQQIVLFGYSQGGAVVSHEMYNLANLDPATKNRIQVVTIGNIENPQGLWARLSFLPTIPILNVTFGPQLPTNIGIKSTNYVFEYDPVGDAPLYLLNPFSLLNALAAFEFVHGDYLNPNSNDPTGVLPYGYTPATLAPQVDPAQHPENFRTYQDATFVLIPQQGTLPIMQPFVDLAATTGTTPFVKPLVDLISPTLKVLINLGYDRTANPGIPRTFQLFPIFNPFTLTADLAGAAAQGVQDAMGDLGGSPLGPLAPLVPTSPSILAGANTGSGPASTGLQSNSTTSGGAQEASGKPGAGGTTAGGSSGTGGQNPLSAFVTGTVQNGSNGSNSGNKFVPGILAGLSGVNGGQTAGATTGGSATNQTSAPGTAPGGQGGAGAPGAAGAPGGQAAA